MEIDNEHACAFTGHRPEKLELDEKYVLSWLEEQIRIAIDDGYREFISGMQRGVDIWAAEIVLRIKKEGKSIKLICACAWDGMEDGWDKDWIDRYKDILKEADKIVYVGKHPGRESFVERDHWMVDHSSRLIAVFTDVPGGTKETIWYGKRKGIDIILIQQSITIACEESDMEKGYRDAEKYVKKYEQAMRILGNDQPSK